MWQDTVITIASIAFVYSMLPQIYYGFKNKVGTITYQFSVITTLAMLALTIAYYSLGLVFSTIVNAIITILWFVLVVQRIIYPTIK